MERHPLEKCNFLSCELGAYEHTHTHAYTHTHIHARTHTHTTHGRILPVDTHSNVKG